jgi:preprotein translocase subunit SecG
LPSKSSEIRGGSMTLEYFMDKLLNLLVFAFIGILVWLYFKNEPEDNEGKSQEIFEEN